MGGLKGGLKGLQKDAKKNWFRLFFDPPGPIKLFSHSFSAWSHRVSPHSDFFLKLSISQNIFKFYAKVAKSLGRNQIWWKTESTNFGHFRTWKVHCFEDVFIAMEVSSNLKIDVFEATSDPWVQLYVCEGMSPKSRVFPIIFGAKIHKTWFSNSFQYFIVNYHNGIFLHVHIFISLVISFIFHGQKTRKLVIMLLLESLLKKSIITNFLIFWPKICKMLPNRIENIYENILF